MYEDLLYHVYGQEPTERSVPTDTREKKDRDGFITFIDAPGGTGKTYTINTFLNYVRGQGDIGLASAFSGVAALLLKGGTHLFSIKFTSAIDSHNLLYLNYFYVYFRYHRP